MRIRRNPRLAFTLVELLVVIAIIGVLVGLTAAGVMKFRGLAMGSATKTNLNKVRAALVNQIKAVSDEAGRESMSAVGPAFLNRAQIITGLLGNSVDGRVKAKYVELKVIQAFPMNFDEVFKPGGDPTLAHPTFLQHLKSMGISVQADYVGVPLEAQSAVCVLMIVEVGIKSGSLSADDLGATTVGPISSGKLQGRGLVDAWRRPVLFTRTLAIPTGPPALLSAGNDGKYGVDMTTATLTVNSPADASDNIVINQ